ncbi:Fic family protein [Nocardia farcinica]|uniref:Fic family protein n=1 Tax=Nocardia farcinica TaxID=37329 RepID=UPI00245670D0|nr:Fic family protein [Nocardia farcinica]
MADDRAPAGWPAIGEEAHPWSLGDAATSRTQRRKHSGEYRAATVPAIARQRVELPAGLLVEAEEAANTLARFDAHRALGTESGPMSAVLLRTESAASSQIENLTVGARKLALAGLGVHTDRNARIVTANVRTMEAALALSREIDRDSVLSMHHALLADSDPATAGRWRDQQVWVGGSALGPHGAMFVPPHHSRVPAAMDDFFEFAARTDVPGLVHVALAHAQFETIHPFTDGNGRTGRALVHAMLHRRGLIRHVTVPLSAGLLVDTPSYFEALTSYRAGDPLPIVRQFIDATFFAVDRGARLVARLCEIRDRYRAAVTARRDSVVWPLIDRLPAQPAVDNAYVRASFGVTDVAAQRAIDRLVDSGVLRAPKSAARNRVWVAEDIIRVLDEFAEGARRVRGGQR